MHFLDDGENIYASCIDNLLYCYDLKEVFDGKYKSKSSKNIPEKLIVPDEFKSEDNDFSNIDISYCREFLVTFLSSKFPLIWNLRRKKSIVCYLEQSEDFKSKFTYFGKGNEMEVRICIYS